MFQQNKIRKKLIEEELTFAKRERVKVLLSANWALLNQICWLLAKALPGNLDHTIERRRKETD